jgi:hypothetical protein
MMTLLALLGAYGFLSLTRSVKTAFIPVIVNGLIVTILYLFALKRHLDGGLAFLTVVGLILLVVTVAIGAIRQNYESLRIFISPSFVFLLLASVLFWLLLRNVRLTDYDNFSHWAVIVKNMSWQHALPDMHSIGIQFSAYPPGSALFIYAVCHHIGFTEAHAVLAQAFLITSAIMPLFAFVDTAFWRKQWRQAGLLAAMMCLLALNFYNGPSAMTSLLVDNVLLLTGLATTIIIVTMAKTPVRATFLVWPLMCTTVLIKNSGMFFTAINTALLLIFIVRWMRQPASHGKHQVQSMSRHLPAGLAAILTLLPYLGFSMWSNHVKHTFTDGSMSKHAVSLQDYITTFHQKTAGDIAAIGREIIKRVFDFTDLHSASAMIVWNVVVLIVLFTLLRTAKPEIRLPLKHTLITVDAIFAAYVVGVYLMYIFSMPKGEALALASFDRYLGTVINYLIGWLIISMVLTVKQLPSQRVFAAFTAIVMIVLVVTLWTGRGTFKDNFSTSAYRNNRVAKVDTALVNANVHGDPMQTILKKDNVGMFVVKSQNPGAIMNYYLQYRFFAKRTSVYHDASAEAYMAKMMLTYRYFIVLSPNAHMANVMRTYFGISDKYWDRTYTASELKKDYRNQLQGYPSR